MVEARGARYGVRTPTRGRPAEHRQQLSGPCGRDEGISIAVRWPNSQFGIAADLALPQSIDRDEGTGSGSLAVRNDVLGELLDRAPVTLS
jgi:hypothetical protein